MARQWNFFAGDDMERSYKKRALLERVMEYVFLAAACVSVLCVALICAFLLANGLPAMGEIGVLKFLSGTRWKPGADIYGIFPMIVGSVYVTAGALLLGVPVALLTAVYLAFFCPKGCIACSSPRWSCWRGFRRWSTVFSALWCSCPRCARSAKDGTAAATRCSPRRSCWRL